MFSSLHVSHVDGKDWRLTSPLVCTGKWEFIIIKAGFVTDFASIPRPVRWLLDNAGRNSEAAVLHDALWRESKTQASPRVDAWDVDGLFRRALRYTGSTALARGLMWFAVRVAAIVRGRFGRLGPSLPVKMLQLVGLLVLASVAALPTTIVATAGLVAYWIVSWIVAVVWHLGFERRHFPRQTNWPWPLNRRRPQLREGYDPDLLVLIPFGDERADRLRRLLAEVADGAQRDLTNEDIDQITAPLEHPTA